MSVENTSSKIITTSPLLMHTGSASTLKVLLEIAPYKHCVSVEKKPCKCVEARLGHEIP